MARSIVSRSSHPMAHVRLGLLLHNARYITYLLAISFALIGPFVLVATLGRVGLALSGLALLWLMGIAPILGIVADILCLVGSPTSLRPHAATCLTLDLAILATGVALILTGSNPIMLLISSIVVTIGWIAFILFVRRLSLLMEGENGHCVAETTIVFLCGLALFILPMPIAYGLSLLLSLAEFPRVAIFILYVLFIGWIFLYCKLMFRQIDMVRILREEILKKLPQRSR